jgi:hypothetical protein
MTGEWNSLRNLINIIIIILLTYFQELILGQLLYEILLPYKMYPFLIYPKKLF